MFNGGAVNGVHLQQLEVSSHAYVRQHPDDMTARLELAWCQLVQAFYEAGREASARIGVLHNAEAGKHWPAESVQEYGASLKDSCLYRSKDLFRDCLYQTVIVQQLSTRMEDHINATHLQALVCLVSGESTLAASQKRLSTCTLAMFRDITHQTEEAG